MMDLGWAFLLMIPVVNQLLARLKILDMLLQSHTQCYIVVHDKFRFSLLDISSIIKSGSRFGGGRGSVLS